VIQGDDGALCRPCAVEAWNVGLAQSDSVGNIVTLPPPLDAAGARAARAPSASPVLNQTPDGDRQKITLPAARGLGKLTVQVGA